MSDVAIQFDHVGKLYRLGLVGTGTLSHDLNRWWQTKILHHEDPYLKVGETNDRAHKGNSDYVWALKDITFDVKEGEVVGIIGKNGAGKSTLLKLLSRVTSPTTGTIRARGRIASLLEVGTGFHGEMTGRENIFMNGSILGMTRAEINRKLDDIVEFAGVERYIDTPVKRYSSGMTVRLGFAVAAFLDPEILVVDEVLAVGDAEFQKKAIGKMQDVSSSEGRTVLFVSHNMGAIRNLCHRGIILEDGCLVGDGDVYEVVDRYLESSRQAVREGFDFGSRNVNGKKAYFEGFSIISGKGDEGNVISFSKGFDCELVVRSQSSVNITARVAVFDLSDNRIMAFDTADIGEIIHLSAGERKTLHCHVEEPLFIRPGHYKVNISIRQGGYLLDHIVGAASFEIEEEDFYGFGRFSSSDMPLVLRHHTWTTE